MAGNLISFQGWGAFNGTFGSNVVTLDSDIVQISLPSVNRRARVRRVGVHVLNLAPAPVTFGWYVDWAIITSDGQPQLLTPAGQGIMSGGQVAPGTFGFGYTVGAAPGGTYLSGIPGVRRYLAGGRVYTQPANNSPPLQGNPQPWQDWWDDDASAPTSEPGELLSFVLFGPQTSPQNTGASAASSFAFHVCVRGTMIDTQDQPLLGLAMTRPLPARGT